MSEFQDSIERDDAEDPPPLDGSLSVGHYLHGVINRLGEGGLLYSDYVNPSSNLYIAVNAHDLEVTGSIRDYEISQLMAPPLHETVGYLEQRVSRAMARAAARLGFGLTDDPEYDYPVFIAPTDNGAVSLMFRRPDIYALITGDRPESYDQPLMLQSQLIKRVDELKVLLSGLAVFLTAFETTKPLNSTK